MSIVIRPFSALDYTGITAVLNAASPEFPLSETEVRGRDSRRGDQCRHARWVATDTATLQIIGVGEYDQRADIYHPRRFTATVFVVPERHGEGVGKQLFETVEEELTELKPLSIRTFAREDRPRAVRFWSDRGFSEVMRDGGAVLELSRCDQPGLPDAGYFAAAGILLRTLAELESDKDRDAKLCDLYNSLLADVPPLGERTPVDLRTFRRLRLDRPDVLPEATFIAVAADSEEYVGVASLYLPPDGSPDWLSTGITGVRRTYRRRGIAQFLKRCCLAYALSRPEVRYVRTWNASDNVPILALNESLGFIREPWRLHLLKTISDC